MATKEPMVVFEVEMTPEEYVQVRKDAQWYGYSVARYLVANATGYVDKRGC